MKMRQGLFGSLSGRMGGLYAFPAASRRGPETHIAAINREDADRAAINDQWSEHFWHARRLVYALRDTLWLSYLARTSGTMIAYRIALRIAVLLMDYQGTLKHALELPTGTLPQMQNWGWGRSGTPVNVALNWDNDVAWCTSLSRGGAFVASNVPNSAGDYTIYPASNHGLVSGGTIHQQYTGSVIPPGTWTSVGYATALGQMAPSITDMVTRTDTW